MKCPKCGAKMELSIPDCASGCCGISNEPILMCPNCGYIED